MRLLLAVVLMLPAVPALAQHGYHFGRNKIQYEAFDWHILRTEHFDVYYYPEMREIAEKGAFFAEEAYEELRHRFNHTIAERVPIIFYSSNLHFKQTNVIPNFIPDGVGGFFEFMKGRVVIPANGDLHRFRHVVRHELVHVFTFSKVARVLRDYRKPVDQFLPLWFTEGLAEHWSGEPDHQHEMMMRDALISNYFVPLEDMVRISGTYLMYKQGEALCGFIAEHYGEEKLLLMIENFWRHTDFRRVMEATLREPIAETSRKWEQWLRARYLPLLEDADVASMVSEGLISRGFAVKPAYHRFPDGRQMIAYIANVDGYTNLFGVEVDDEMKPVGRPEVLIRGERSEQFEAFNLFDSRLDVSRHGRLAFVTRSGENDVVHIYDLNTRRHEVTYRFDELIAIYSPTWDPTGSRFAFSSIDRSGFSDLYLYDINEGSLRRLTRDAYDDRNPAWSPDGRQIAFSSNRTTFGRDDAFNLFTYDLQDDRIDYVTYGPWNDFSPTWSPDGSRLVFTSTRRDDDGRYSGQDLWVADMSGRPGAPDRLVTLAAADDVPDTTTPDGRLLHRLTRFSSAVFDPVWTDTGRFLFSSFEAGRFTVRHMDADSLLARPRETVAVRLDGPREAWAFDRIPADEGERSRPYRRRYNLDVAQGAVNTNPVFGNSGGAVLAFSDMLGNDRIFVSVYSTSTDGRGFLDGLNVAAMRLHMGRRANVGYGAYRLGGLRYDLTDPDAASIFPVYYERLYGGFGLVQYPISMFRRIEINTSLNWSEKEVFIRDLNRDALLLSNSVSLVHDNALYGWNGPIDGWRASLTAGYTTDLRYSNVGYYTLIADLRHYLRLGRDVTLASWGMARTNVGREARLWLLGGSWDMRGFPLFRIRGRNMVFTSHELRFPLVHAPSVFLPFLAPFGVANLRGAAFVDAARAWNESFDRVEPELFTGRTLGATGLGLRMNLFGGFVLRYDFGWRFQDGFDWGRRETFRQFFFGWDF